METYIRPNIKARFEKRVSFYINVGELNFQSEKPNKASTCSFEITVTELTITPIVSAHYIIHPISNSNTQKRAKS